MRQTRGVKSCGEEQHPRRYVFVNAETSENTAPNIMMCEAFIVRLSLSRRLSLFASWLFVFPQAPGLLSHGIRSGLESTTLCVSQDQISQPLEDQQGYRTHALSVHQCLMSSSISYDPWQAFLFKIAGSSHLSWTLRCTPRKWNWNKSSIFLDKNSHQNPAGLSSTTSFSSYGINSLPLSHGFFPHTSPLVQSCCFHKILR